MSKKLIKFRVHKAVFLDEEGKPNSPVHLFLNVRNDGNKPITVHAIKSMHSGDWRRVRNSQRPLPLTLAPGKEWETWTRQTTKNEDNYYRFLLVYSTGKYVNNVKYLHATKRYNVPPKGEVPTGK